MSLALLATSLTLSMALLVRLFFGLAPVAAGSAAARLPLAAALPGAILLLSAAAA
jgi:hypothetical protein